jgi:hypothetical protein
MRCDAFREFLVATAMRPGNTSVRISFQFLIFSVFSVVQF